MLDIIYHFNVSFLRAIMHTHFHRMLLPWWKLISINMPWISCWAYCFTHDGSVSSTIQNPYFFFADIAFWLFYHLMRRFHLNREKPLMLLNSSALAIYSLNFVRKCFVFDWWVFVRKQNKSHFLPTLRQNCYVSKWSNLYE